MSTKGESLRERLNPYTLNGRGELRGNVHVPVEVATYLRRTGQWAIPAGLVDDVLAALADTPEPSAPVPDALVEELADLFGWEDRSYMHALLHVRNAVLDLAVAQTLTTPSAPTGEPSADDLAERHRQWRREQHENEYDTATQEDR